MKHAILLIFTVAILTSNAQSPVLTSAFGPQIGDVFTIQPVDVSGITIHSGGINQTWDYSTAADSGSATVVAVIDPASTPYASSYPGATVALTNVGSSDTGYIYEHVGTNQLTFLGNYVDVAGGVYYSPGRVLMQYPLAYGSAFANPVSGYSDNGDTITGVDSVTADGYGTLTLPGGHTYTDVLRIRYAEHTHSVNSGFAFFEDIDQIEYAYYTAGYHDFLFDIQYTTNNINGSSFSAITAQYAKNVTTGVSDISQAKYWSVYPNPCSGKFSIKVSGENSVGAVVSVTDLTGKVIAEQAVHSANETIDLNQCAKGIYIVSMKNDHATTTTKISLE